MSTIEAPHIGQEMIGFSNRKDMFSIIVSGFAIAPDILFLPFVFVLRVFRGGPEPEPAND
jgi:hypothetical protein